MPKPNKAEQIRKFVEGVQHREISIDPDSFVRAEGDDPEAPIEIAFSSENVVRQGYGPWAFDEILDHSPGSVRLDRLNGGAPFLVNHDRGDLAGVIESGSARIDDDAKGRAQIRFSRSDRGQEIESDMRDGIRLLVSVGYKVHKHEVTEREGQPDLVRITDWEPFEVSSVTVPADTAVGVGRSDDGTHHTAEQEGRAMPEEQKPNEDGFDAAAEKQRLRTEETRRRSAIDEIADKFDIPEDVHREAIRNEDESWDVEKFRAKALDIVGERNNKAKAESGSDGELDLSRGDRESFSLVRLMDHLADRDDRHAREAAGFELEVSREGAKLFGSDFRARGEYVPTSILTGIRAANIDNDTVRGTLGGKSGELTPAEFVQALRALSAGAAGGAAELVGTDHMASMFIDVLRNASAVMRAGITMLPGLVGNVDIPRQTGGATSDWLANEDDDAPNSEPTFDQLTMSPKDLACYTEFTRRLTQQSAPAIEGLVRNDLASAQGLGIDRAALYGTGAAGQPTGVANQTGINVLDLAAAAPTYIEIVQMIKLVMEDNALIGPASWIFDANGWESLSTTPKQPNGAEGNFILGDNERVKGYSYTQSQQVQADDFFFGVWSQLVMGEWGGLEINVDPYTHSLKGRIRYITFKTIDIIVRHPEAFCNANTEIVP